MVGLIIYLIGVIASYWLVKKWIKSSYEDVGYMWFIVFLRVMWCGGSWITFILSLIIVLLNFASKKWEKVKIPKPPKWL